MHTQQTCETLRCHYGELPLSHTCMCAPVPELDDIRKAGHNDVIGLLRAAARHPHKGPNDTDVSMLQAAAKRLRGGYEPGGSHTKQTVARVIELVASLIEEEADHG